jgi:adenylate cyclase
VVGGAPRETQHFTRRVRAVLVVDMVESVRLIQQDEEGVIRRWRDFVDAVIHAELPAHGGRMVKSLGDGMLIELDSAPSAVKCALAMQARIAASEASAQPDRQIQLRMGIHVADVIVDDVDLFGEGVNLAARLAALAGPGEIVASAEACDGLTPTLDADIEDLGDCYLKHLQHPVRAYRIGPAARGAAMIACGDYTAALQPTIAVIPFSARSDEPEHFAIGELIADGVISLLSRSQDVRVVSRLSTTAFRDRVTRMCDVERHLGATYVISGSYLVHSMTLLVTAELADARTNQVIWAEQVTGAMDDLLRPGSELIGGIGLAACGRIFDVEMHQSLTRPLPTLESYSLLLGSINRMHRSSRDDFLRTREVLEHLIERHQRVSSPRTWLAQWYVLKTTRGMSVDRAREAKEALDMTRRALDIDPSDALAMAVEGFVYCHLLRDLATAQERCEQAIAANPNQASAWLYDGVIQAFRGHGSAAVDATQRALALSPIDPQRYYFESLAATAAVAASDYPRAQALAESSLKLNRMHSSTWRMLTVALVQQGKMEDARLVLQRLLQLEPNLTVAGYLARIPNSELATGLEWARALAAAGLPTGN